MKRRKKARIGLNRLFRLPLRWFLLSVLMGLTGMVVFIVALFVHPLSGMSLLTLIPVLWLFSFGSLRARLLNGLPLIALFAFLFTGFTYGRWDQSTWVFIAVPYVGLVLKPRRHPLKYAMILISTLMILANGYGVLDIGIVMRIGYTLVIYGVFMPPILLSRIKREIRKLRDH